MSLNNLRFRPPDDSYDGFKFRMALVLCLVFGFFAVLFFGKHFLVINGYTLHFLPEPLKVIGSYLHAYYLKNLFGALEMLLILAGFGATFWLNWPKQYFADRYRDYGKERPSAEAKSVTWLLTFTAFGLTLFSIPFLTLHFPVWVSFLFKFGPVAAGILRYLSIIPETKNIERIASIAKLDWDTRSFEPSYSSAYDPALAKELEACQSLLGSTSPEAARRFVAQGSATVVWSGVDALYNSLEAWLGVSAESLSLYEDAARGIEFALGELLDARGAKPALILTSDAEDPTVLDAVRHLQPVYRFDIETAPVQDLLWNNASSAEIVSALANRIAEKKPDIAVLSHVFADTGAVLDLKELVDAVRQKGIQTLFVIDGSHAVGNILVDDDAFVRSEYYAFNGHNWLLGVPSIAVLVRNQWLLRMSGVPAQRKIAREEPSTSEGLAPWFAFHYILKREWLAVGAANAAKHRKTLADLFRDEMHKRDIRLINISCESSSVVITGIPRSDLLHRALQSKGVRCTLVSHGSLSDSFDTHKRAMGIRFCFHHYHGDDELRDLAECIGDLTVEGFATPGTSSPECNSLPAGIDTRERMTVESPEVLVAGKR